MKNKILCGLALLCGMGATSLSADGLYIVPEIGYSLPTEKEIDDTYFLGLRLGSEISDNLAIEIESGYSEYKIDFTDRIQNVDMQHIPLLINLHYSFSGWDKGGLFIFAGAGVGFNDLDNPIDSGNDADDTFSWQAGLGYEADLSDSTALVFDVRYYRNDPDLDFDSELALSAVLFNLGIKFGG